MIYLLLLIPLITQFCLSISHPGLVSLLLLFPWAKSYLLNRSFYVRIDGTVSSVYQFLYGVLLGSVLGPRLLFILYTTPLSTSFLTHLQIIIAKQMTLNFSYLFSAASHSHNIALLESAISSVSNWMSANLLTINHSKTEFLIIGLPQQLSKLSFSCIRLPKNVTDTPVDSPRSLGVMKSFLCST